MDRALLAAAIVGAALLVAAMLRRRTGHEPPTRTGYVVPDQLDRRDFVRPGAPVLVVLFSSATCESCAGTWELVRQVESPDVAVQDVAFQVDGELHRRYDIDAVPMVVAADRAGVVRWSSAGPTSAEALAAGIGELLPGGRPPA